MSYTFMVRCMLCLDPIWPAAQLQNRHTLYRQPAGGLAAAAAALLALR
jgi:hypothetical protein